MLPAIVVLLLPLVVGAGTHAASAATAPAADPSAASAPLQVVDLLRLAERGVGERVLRLLVRQSGLAGPLTVEDVLALEAAGLSDDLLAGLLESWSAQQVANPAVSYTHEDGVLVVRAKGDPDPPAPMSVARTQEPPPPPEPLAVAPTVVVVQAPAASAVPAPAETFAEPPASGYPVGAAFGPAGGVVFLPHTFGGAPGHLGTTIVQSSPVVLNPFWPAVPVLAPVPGAGPAWDGVPGPPYGTIGIRTSRGVIQVPR